MLIPSDVSMARQNTYNYPKFCGSFIKKGNFSLSDSIYIDKFIEENSLLLRRKPYNIEIRERNGNYIPMFSSFMSLYSKSPYECLISMLDAGTKTIQETLSRDKLSFEVNLAWFENYKKSLNGYNNVFEKFVSGIKDLF